MNSKLSVKKVCEWCGSEFLAHKTTTRFCCHRCACMSYKHRKRRQAVDALEGYVSETKVEKLKQKVSEREILSITLTAEYLGVSRSSVYRYLETGILKCIQLPGKTLIRKSDIELLFDEASPYNIRKMPAPREAITELTTVKETAEKYGMSMNAVYVILKDGKVPTVKNHGKSYYSLQHVERIFKKREAESFPDIKAWYTLREVIEKYNMSNSSVYTMVYDNAIPSKRAHGTTLYSKMHVDQVKEARPDPALDTFYTVEAAMKKYSFTRDQVYGYLRYYKIERFKVGRCVRFSRETFDAIFQCPSIPP